MCIRFGFGRVHYTQLERSQRWRVPLKELTMGHLVQRLFLYFGLAVAALTIFALVFALSMHTGISIQTRWVGLTIWTLIIFVVVVRSNGSYWNRVTYWLAVCGLLGVHLLAFVGILRRYPQWRPIWFVPIAIAEAGVLSVILDMLLDHPAKRRRHQKRANRDISD
jgi:hypothetical protein